MKRRAKKKNPWEDHYSRKAKKERYPARSVYKLQEMQQKYQVIKKGNRILDLGCAPGSWLLHAAELTGSKGLVVGIDKKPVTIRIPANVQALTGDVLSLEDKLLESIGSEFHVVMSDMAPVTSGHKDVDAVRSLDLCKMALSVARDRLLPGGTFICKIFTGENSKAFSDTVKTHFKARKMFKPQSSRKASREIFIIGMGMKQ